MYDFLLNNLIEFINNNIRFYMGKCNTLIWNNKSQSSNISPEAISHQKHLALGSSKYHGKNSSILLSTCWQSVIILTHKALTQGKGEIPERAHAFCMNRVLIQTEWDEFGIAGAVNSWWMSCIFGDFLWKKFNIFGFGSWYVAEFRFASVDIFGDVFFIVFLWYKYKGCPSNCACCNRFVPCERFRE